MRASKLKRKIRALAGTDPEDLLNVSLGRLEAHDTVRRRMCARLNVNPEGPSFELWDAFDRLVDPHRYPPWPPVPAPTG